MRLPVVLSALLLAASLSVGVSTAQAADSVRKSAPVATPTIVPACQNLKYC